MDVTLSARHLTDCKADVYVVAARADASLDELAPLDRMLNGALLAEARRQGFGGGEGEVATFQTHGALPARYVVLVGLGRSAGSGGGAQPWYRLADALIGRARELKAAAVALGAPGAPLTPPVLERIAEGLLLSAYRFTRLKSARAESAASPASVIVAGCSNDTAARAAVSRGRIIATATCYARDLVNLPAATVTPAYLAREAVRIGRAQGLRVRILDEPAMKRAGMGALLGVGQGSAQPPRFIELVYRPRERVRRRVALAGKGITFDSGGLSIKPAEAMQAQKRDMAGGAAVLAVMSVARDLALPVEVRAYVPAAENMPGSRALKPGDVVRACNGTTIEVLNTDAEGRLVLADALACAAAAKPDVLIDLATLTAAVRAALGTRYAAVLGSDPGVVGALIAAAAACTERLWELPLVDEYRTELDSTVADLKNIGEGGAGTIIGALFLREFTAGLPWAHIDFSSTAMADKPYPCHPRGATGFGVRTLLQYLRTL